MRVIVAGVMLLSLLAGGRAEANGGWIKVYLGDSERAPVVAEGTCTIIVSPASGKRMKLEAELVTSMRTGTTEATSCVR